MFNETENQTDESQIEKLDQSENKYDKKKKSYSIIGISLIALLIVVGAFAVYFYRNDIISIVNEKLNLNEEIDSEIDISGKTDCPSDVKKCSDGSSVTRILPDCEFKECPEIIEDETADWQTYRNEELGFEFKYPNTLIEPQKIESNSDYSFAFYPKETGGDRLIIGYITKERVNSSNAECLKKSDNQNNESIKTLNTEATINWTKFTGTKMPIGHACIQYSDGGIVFLTFYLINDESKLIFRELISTFKFLQDIDNDGLSDNEEAKYGCDLNNPDSDGDGYLDGDEVKNGYNPMGEGKL